MLGIDVSNVNGWVAWPHVKSSGIYFAYIKATEGLTYNDDHFVINRSAAVQAGIAAGAYHFARPDLHPGVRGAQAEADHFCRVVGSVKRGELRPALDFEHAPADALWAGAFLSRVHEKLGVGPVLYSYSGFLTSAFAPLGRLYPLWLANYGINDGREHPVRVPVGWKGITAHQFTSRGHKDGVRGYVDLDSAASLAPLLAYPPKPPRNGIIPNPLKPKTVPGWWYRWAEWIMLGKDGGRPYGVPRIIPIWAWILLHNFRVRHPKH